MPTNLTQPYLPSSQKVLLWQKRYEWSDLIRQLSLKLLRSLKPVVSWEVQAPFPSVSLFIPLYLYLELGHLLIHLDLNPE
jgi:hypothetical protein